MGFKIESALLEACVLSVVMKEDTYGYIYDEPFQGRNRRYYTITDKGRAKYAEYAEEWKEYKGKIDKMLAGGGNDE